MFIWLVGLTPLKNMKVSWKDYPIYIYHILWENKIHVPKHQAVYVLKKQFIPSTMEPFPWYRRLWASGPGGLQFMEKNQTKKEGILDDSIQNAGLYPNFRKNMSF
jgi:hypothetical protein